VVYERVPGTPWPHPATEQEVDHYVVRGVRSPAEPPVDGWRMRYWADITAWSFAWVPYMNGWLCGRVKPLGPVPTNRPHQTWCLSPIDPGTGEPRPDGLTVFLTYTPNLGWEAEGFANLASIMKLELYSDKENADEDPADRS
jgi:hypothetical protein